MLLIQLPLLLAVATAPLQSLADGPVTVAPLAPPAGTDSLLETPSRLGAADRPHRIGPGPAVASQPADRPGGPGFGAADAARRVPGRNRGEPVGRVARGGPVAGRRGLARLAVRGTGPGAAGAFRAGAWGGLHRACFTRSPLPGGPMPSRRASGCFCSLPPSTGWTRATAPRRATSAPPRSCRWCRTGFCCAPPRSPTTAPAGHGSISGSTTPLPRRADRLGRGRGPRADRRSGRRCPAVPGDRRRLTALRLRLEMTPDSCPAPEVRRDLFALVTGGRRRLRSARAPSGCWTASLPRCRWTRSCWWLGRRATPGWPPAPSPGYPRALAAGLGGQAERFGYAAALARLGRNGEAAVQFKPGAVARLDGGFRRLPAARSLVRDGQLVEGRAALVEIGAKYPRDTTAASSALFPAGRSRLG